MCNSLKKEADAGWMFYWKTAILCAGAMERR